MLLNYLVGPVTTPRVKTWFIIQRLFEPEEPSDAVPAGGGGDTAAHVTVKVENAVLDGGVKEVVLLLLVPAMLSCHLILFMLLFIQEF